MQVEIYKNLYQEFFVLNEITHEIKKFYNYRTLKNMFECNNVEFIYTNLVIPEKIEKSENIQLQIDKICDKIITLKAIIEIHQTRIMKEWYRAAEHFKNHLINIIICSDFINNRIQPITYDFTKYNRISEFRKFLLPNAFVPLEIFLYNLYLTIYYISN